MARQTFAALLVLAAFAAQCSAVTLRVTPVQQVISLLSELKAKGHEMLEDEKKVFAAYAEWVDDETKKLGFEIKDGERQIEELVAFITKADSDVAVLGEEINALDAEINQLSAEKKEATEQRAKDHDEYLKLSEDYAESVDALQRAIQVLSAQDFDRAQAESMLQKMAVSVPGMPRVLAAFLQEKGHSALRGDGGAPEVAAYEFQSGGIVELLEGLLKKFKKELAAVEEGESNQAHEFALLEIHLTDTINKDQKDRDEKAIEKGQSSAASAKAQGELTEVKAEKAADEQLQADTQATFKVKTAAFEGNQQVRVQELEAIGKAIEIMSSPTVAGSYGKHVNAALQVAARGHHTAKGASLLQLSRTRHRIGNRQRAADLLAKSAKMLNSRLLSQAAAQVSANPFEKVIGMIEDLISKLKAEAAAEAEHKAWCDEQLKSNKLKREEKTAEADKLLAEVQSLEATIADQGAQIEKLVSEQAGLTQAMSEATEIRSKEKAENTQTIADAAAGVEAVGKALVVLKEFYASQQPALIQQVPELAAYKGQQGSAKGVVGLLEVIESDFARLKAETEAAEQAAASEYDTFMQESKISSQRKHEAEVKLRLDKDQAEYEKGETSKDLANTQEELDKATKYFDYLKPNCLEVKVSWEERVAQREAELEALKQAYEILDQKSVA